MKLFLASEAKLPESLEKLRTFSGELSHKHIAFIPTAANGVEMGSWKQGRSVEVVSQLSDHVDIIELENFQHESTLEAISRADVIWLSGGMSGYLLYWIRRVQLDKILPSLLNQGSLLVGSSSGSMVCSQTQEASEWFIGDPEPGAGLIPGLGLVDFEIYPHYEDHLHDEIARMWKRGKIYLLKDGEVITISNGKVEILGEERIIEK